MIEDKRYIEYLEQYIKALDEGHNDFIKKLERRQKESFIMTTLFAIIMVMGFAGLIFALAQ
jgi:hypothetical protein